jgi:hypothetical protein
MPDNLITLDQAVQMTTLYRNQKENILAQPFQGLNILATCETFDRGAFDTLLSEGGCVSVRIYYGMSADLKVQAIVVGVDSNNEDILPASGLRGLSSTAPVIVEEGTRCPDDCPPTSPLNP